MVDAGAAVASAPVGNTAPTVSAVAPTSTKARRPAIGATVKDAQAALKKTDIRLTVDGRSITTFTYNAANGRVSYVPPRLLAYGVHRATVTATDQHGFAASKSWIFKVVR